MSRNPAESLLDSSANEDIIFTFEASDIYGDRIELSKTKSIDIGRIVKDKKLFWNGKLMNDKNDQRRLFWLMNEYLTSNISYGFNMMIFEAWMDEESITFATPENVADLKRKGLLSSDAKFLYKIEAESYDEAMTLHNQKMGWEPYKPMK